MKQGLGLTLALALVAKTVAGPLVVSAPINHKLSTAAFGTVATGTGSALSEYGSSSNIHCTVTGSVGTLVRRQANGIAPTPSPIRVPSETVTIVSDGGQPGTDVPTNPKRHTSNQSDDEAVVDESDGH